jgi:hypothetical protein
VKRRAFLPLIFIPVVKAGDAEKATIRGKLDQTAGSPPKLIDSSGKPIQLSGDEPTRGVLGDPRLKDADFEVSGHFTAPGSFEIDPIHTRSLFAYRDGKRLMVTYWCDICYIRTYTPGSCWCCQEWTDLDLRPPDAPDPKP